MKATMWKIIRENENLKQVEVAEKIGVSRQSINDFEKGKLKSKKLQAYYLRLRGLKEDLIIAEYLENQL